MITRWLISGLAGALSGGISYACGVTWGWSLVIAGVAGFLTAVTRDLWILIFEEWS